MHTFNAHGTTIFHDNDIRSGGRVHIQNDGPGAGFSCPQQAIIEFVAHLVAGEKISELEQEPMAALGLVPSEAQLAQLKAAALAAEKAMAEASDLLMTLPGGHQAVPDSLDSARTDLLQALQKAGL